MKILITGVAGFIGFHVAKKMIQRGDFIVGVDSLNDYYSPAIKNARLEILHQEAIVANNFLFIRGNLSDKSIIDECFKKHDFDRVIHLAAQAGVRYSLENPQAYVESNIVAYVNILEACRYQQVPHLTYASTSSVYGANTVMPFKESQGANHPIQFYAATKRANELMAHSYSYLFNLPTTGLRFFTVYGPWGRPDMALFKFTKNIIEEKPIQLFNQGNHTRDFTYIGDIVAGIISASDQIPNPNPSWNSNSSDPSSSSAPYKIYNIGNSMPIKLTKYIDAIEKFLGKKAIREYLPLQPGDVPDTYADIGSIQRDLNYKPYVNVDEGVKSFIDWYRDYYDV